MRRQRATEATAIRSTRARRRPHCRGAEVILRLDVRPVHFRSGCLPVEPYPRPGDWSAATKCNRTLHLLIKPVILTCYQQRPLPGSRRFCFQTAIEVPRPFYLIIRHSDCRHASHFRPGLRTRCIDQWYPGLNWYRLQDLFGSREAATAAGNSFSATRLIHKRKRGLHPGPASRAPARARSGSARSEART